MIVLWETGHKVRSSSGMTPLTSGQTLASGTQLHAQIASHRNGYIYLYLWSASQGGKFLFPAPHMRQDNRIYRGDQFMVPARGTWVIDQAAGQEEYLYLLYSAEKKEIREEGTVVEQLKQARASKEVLEKQLSKHFSIEQIIFYHHR